MRLLIRAGRAFLPKPEVDVGLVHFKPRIEPIIALPFNLIEKVVTAAYSYRQKYAVKGLRCVHYVLTY